MGKLLISFSDPQEEWLRAEATRLGLPSGVSELVRRAVDEYRARHPEEPAMPVLMTVTNSKGETLRVVELPGEQFHRGEPVHYQNETEPLEYVGRVAGFTGLVVVKQPDGTYQHFGAAHVRRPGETWQDPFTFERGQDDRKD